MNALVLTLHILACIMLIVLVLLQSGKEGMGVIFGGGSSSMFGGSGAGGLLTKVTAFLAVTFLVTSLVYNILSSSKVADSGSVIMGKPAVETTVPAPEAAQQPAAGAAPEATQETEKQTAPFDGIKVEEPQTEEKKAQ